MQHAKFRLDDHPVAFLRPRLSFPFAWAGHIPFAYLAVDLLRPRQLVELGTDSGNSYLAFCQAVEFLGLDTHCSAVDTWQGDEHARKYADDVYLGLRAYHDPLYARFSDLKRCLFDDAMRDFADGSIDLLHIDGLHTYDAVRHDVDTWLPKLSDRAVLLLHDTQVRDRDFGVWRLLSELADRFPVFEFTHSNGLGVVQVGKAVPDAFKAFMHAAITEPNRIRACFSQLAQTIVTGDGSAPVAIDVIAPDLVCSLFYRAADEAYAEDRRLGVKIGSAIGAQKVAFHLPAGVRPDYLRFDPCEAPGVFGVRALSLETVEPNPVLVEISGLQDRLGFVHCDLLPDEDAGSLCLVALGRDPYVEIDVRDCMARLPAFASIVVRCTLTIDAVLTKPNEWVLADRQGQAVSGLRQLAAEQLSLRALQRELARVRENGNAWHAEAVTIAEARQTEARIALGEIRAAEEAIRSRQERMEAMLAAIAMRQMRPGLARRILRRIRNAPLKMGLTPIRHLELLDAAKKRWRITDVDPAFACASDRFPLRPGWYEVRADMSQHSGRPAQVILYPDFGPDAPPDIRGRCLPRLEPGQQRLVGLARFEFPVYGLRFDPANSTCELTIRRLSLQRVGKLRAAWFLWRHRSMGVVEQAPGLLTQLRVKGLRATVDELYGRYAVPAPPERGYDAWVEDYDTPSQDQLDAARKESREWTNPPTLSVLVPTYNSDEKWLRRCLDSVLAQAWPHWELCVADDASPEPRVLQVLQDYARRDNRIKVMRRSSNGHISATSNSALALATGDYVALLDHDDELHPMALLEVARVLREHPEWRLIYTDEDKIDLAGRRYDPYMKPDWNYELLLGHNCISHLGVYQRKLLDEVGGFREGFEGSQDWDLALRCVEKLSGEEIGHIPHVLYHWRAIPGSTAVAVDEKDYARNSGLLAIMGHLQREKINAIVGEIDGRPGNFRVRHALPEHPPKVSLIIPTRDGLRLLKRCVDSILAQTVYPNYEVVIVDNQSSEPETLAYFRSLAGSPRVRVLAWDHAFNYSALNNFAVRQVDADVVALVNNDIEVISPDWLDEMVSQALRPGIGVVGAMLYYPDDTIQHAGVIVGMHGVASHAYCHQPRGTCGQMGRARLVQELSAVTAACMVVRKAIYEEVHGLDETFEVAFNDIDFCLRVRQAGYRNVWTPFAELYHHESATRGYEDSPEKVARFNGEVRRMMDRWHNEFLFDPAYSPNLTLMGASFDLSFPPRIDRFGVR